MPTLSSNSCKVCVKPFDVGHKGCCSMDCHLQFLQSRLETCFRNDISHMQLLTML